MAVSDDAHYLKKRRFTRYAVEARDIQAHMLLSEDVSLYDVSVNGVCIYTKKDLRVGGKYLINIPDGQLGRHIRCRAVWKTESINEDDGLQEYMVGMQFENIASDEVVMLKDFMRASGAPDEKRVSNEYKPSPLRFTIVSNKKTTLKLPKILNVRKISLGGMLLESDSALGLEDHYPVKLPLPHDSAAITCQARIASVIPRSESSTSRFDIGIEFLGMGATDKERLGSFIHSLEVKA